MHPRWNWKALIFWLAIPSAALARAAPPSPTTAPAILPLNRPATPTPRRMPRVTLAKPHLNPGAPAREFSLPAAFWNEHLTNWLDVALCGRPSNFLHETILSIPTTRSIVRRAFGRIGFHPASEWAPSLANFAAIRGQPVLILVRFRRHAIMQTFPLEELISLRGWNTAIGPFGWLYLGTPLPYPAPAAVRGARGGQSASPNAILADDPQIAMQFRGIIHQSQALLDFPLCFDDWIYPNIRYYRNVSVLPWRVFNSNGAIPAQVIFRRVSQAAYLKTASRYWHNRRYARYILKQIPLAKVIDKVRRRLWKLKSAERRRWNHSRAIARCAVRLQSCYAALDAAWIDWDYAHAHFHAESNRTRNQVRRQALWFKQHIDQKRSQYHQLWLATVAKDQLLALEKKPGQKTDTRRIAVLRAAELAARSRSLLDANRQSLSFWERKKKHLAPNDPRKAWAADIRANLALAQARRRLGKEGIAYARAIKSGGKARIAAAQQKYMPALLRQFLAAARVQLVRINFRIAEDRGLVPPAQMAALQKQRAAIQKNMQRYQNQMAQLAPAPPATRP